jgi:hypothetical protein
MPLNESGQSTYEGLLDDTDKLINRIGYQYYEYKNFRDVGTHPEFADRLLIMVIMGTFRLLTYLAREYAKKR